MWGRVTTSDAIATAECIVFSNLYSMHANVHYLRVPELAAAVIGGDVYIHPGNGVTQLSHQAVLHAYRTVQLRSTESKSFDHCTFGTFAPLDSPRQSIPIFLDTYSADHNA